MFAVLFEVQPRDPHQWDAYLGYAKMLRPELEAIDGFVDNVRYRSLTRPDWILSLSSWRNEKALVRWRTRARHHDVQVKGRERVLADYHLRIGQITADSDVPPGYRLEEQRLDVTETGAGNSITLTNPLQPYQEGRIEESAADSVARELGLRTDAIGLVSWDVFDGVLTPGNPILLQSWRDEDCAAAASLPATSGLRSRTARIVRDYGMYDRRENPQYYPDIAKVNGAQS
jgi:heme-degrading monooxygenase HmoA